MLGFGIRTCHVKLKPSARLDGGSFFIFEIEIKIRVADGCRGTAESKVENASANRRSLEFELSIFSSSLSVSFKNQSNIGIVSGRTSEDPVQRARPRRA